MIGRSLVALALVATGAVGALLYQQLSAPDATETRPAAGGRPPGPGGAGPGGRGGFGPQPLLVDTARVTRADVTEELEIVGNLVGAATIEVAPKVNGRLRQVNVRIGDRVSRGQPVARVEDDELQQQVSQAEAAFAVAQATVRQREADLTLARTNRERSESLFDRALVSRQELDDGEARYQAATAQLDLAKAQFDEASARLQELRINLENTVMLSPVNGFVGRRYLDPGAYVTQNNAVVSIVEISLVRLVANLVERDLSRVREGVRGRIEVDAFPGEAFQGQVARIAPVLDPATRTAEIEIEIPNPEFRLKPGMYARVSLDVGTKTQALVVPREAVVLRSGARGVFTADVDAERPTVRFVSLAAGLEDERYVEVLEGLSEGDFVVTVGAAGLQHGSPITVNGREPSGERRPRQDAQNAPSNGQRASANQSTGR